jgi:hypothetical protein
MEVAILALARRAKWPPWPSGCSGGRRLSGSMETSGIIDALVK